MADLNLRPVKEVTEASVVLKPTWVQEVRPYVSLASEVLSPQHACAVLTEDSVGSPLQTVSHLQGCWFLQQGALFAWNFIWTRFYEECISSGKLWPSANHIPGSAPENCSAEFSSA